MIVDFNRWQRAWIEAVFPAGLENDKYRILGFGFTCAINASPPDFTVYASNLALMSKGQASKSRISRLRRDAVKAGMLVPTGEFAKGPYANHKGIEKLALGWPENKPGDHLHLPG